MNFDKEKAFKVLSIISPITNPNGKPTLSMMQTELKKHFGEESMIYVEYLTGEGLIKIENGQYKLTNKTINLLTDGIDMETWIKNNKPSHS